MAKLEILGGFGNFVTFFSRAAGKDACCFCREKQIKHIPVQFFPAIGYSEIYQFQLCYFVLNAKCWICE
ncbi:hypothetical protein OXX80_012283 [Metschnikowia pulcherrima]